MSAMLGGVGSGAGAMSGVLAPYQVALCSLLLQYADLGRLQPPSAEDQAAQRRLFAVLFRELCLSTSHLGWPVRKKSVAELRRDLCEGPEAESCAEDFVESMRRIDSPDALFDLFARLGDSVAREPGEASPLHASGIFGQHARRCALAFRAASFEAVVKLFDAVQGYLEDYDRQATCRTADVAVLGDGRSWQSFARSLARELPLSLGSVPFPRVDGALLALQGQSLPSHGVLLLRYTNCLQHRMSDEAASHLRAFHDRTQRYAGLSLGAPRSFVPEGGAPETIQRSLLALAGLHCEMWQTDDALQALGKSIRCAQEASDDGCLCACLYTLSLVLLQAGSVGKAFAMLRRCLQRSEAIGSTVLQSLCCLGIARAIAERPALSDRQRGAILRESATEAGRSDRGAPVVFRTQAAGAGAGSTSGALGAIGQRGGGLRALAALQEDEGSGPGSDVPTSVACRDALAHVALASQLSSQAARLEASRPRVLLCQAEVSQLFGLRPLAAASCRLALDVYGPQLSAEERALARCQLAATAAQDSAAEAVPFFRGVAGELPYAAHLWAHVAGPCVVKALLSAGRCASASAVLFQVVGAARAAPHTTAVGAVQRARVAANAMRLHNRQFLAAQRSAREAVEGGRRGLPGDICGHLLCLADAHLSVGDPIGALGFAMRCLSAAEASRLLQHRAEALVRIARAKLELGDLFGALSLAEDAAPQLHAAGSAKLRGDALMVQAEVLLLMLAQAKRDDRAQALDERMCGQALREAKRVLSEAAGHFEVAGDLGALCRCDYACARVCHELGDSASRNRHAGRFRRISQDLDGGISEICLRAVSLDATCFVGGVGPNASSSESGQGVAEGGAAHSAVSLCESAGAQTYVASLARAPRTRSI